MYYRVDVRRFRRFRFRPLFDTVPEEVPEVPFDYIVPEEVLGVLVHCFCRVRERVPEVPVHFL